MNSIEVFLFGICFAATAGCAFAFMWQSMNMLKEKPRKRNVIHPEMQNVQSGEELLVFKADREEDDDDDVIIIRK